MTYDELIEALAGLSGRMVEATIRTPYEDPESGSGGEWYGSFSGEVDRLGDEAVSGRGHRTLYWREAERTRPHQGSITVWRRGFEGAEVRGTDRTLEEVVAEEEEGQGTTWTVNIFQRGLLIELKIYI